jgi:OHCU decarboxylase
VQAIETLNAASPEEFAEGIRPLFEAAPALAQALYGKRPFASYQDLVDTAEALAMAMSDAEKVAVLEAHPRIGANRATVSAASFKEQGYSAEAGMDPVEVQRMYAELSDLNHQYEQKFGFRFVVFVNRRPRTEIITVLRERMQRGREEELATGLHDMFRIARDRLASGS